MTVTNSTLCYLTSLMDRFVLVGCILNNNQWQMSHNIYRGRFLFTLVCAPENIEGAGVCVALVDVHYPEVNIQSTCSPAMSRWLIPSVKIQNKCCSAHLLLMIQFPKNVRRAGKKEHKSYFWMQPAAKEILMSFSFTIVSKRLKRLFKKHTRHFSKCEKWL